MIIWINGTHGAGKTTTSHRLQELLPDSRIFDAEKVGETLMDITPGLPATDNFQHWPPWRPLVVETAHRILDYTGGLLIVPMTILIEQYWREISEGLAQHEIAIRHFVLHTDETTLRYRIENDAIMGPSNFRFEHIAPYFEAAQAWLHDEATVVDTSNRDAGAVAQHISEVLFTPEDRDPIIRRTKKGAQ